MGFISNQKLEIGILGAGFSGICAAIQLQKKLGHKSFTILEQNSDVGGTWLNNTYPGCASDAPSHLYSYSFEPNPNWTTNYASHSEIRKYLKSTAEKYNIYAHIKFNILVKKLTWDKQLLKWIAVTVDSRNPNAKPKIIIFDIIINAPGYLRQPLIPNEYLSFEGPIIHSSQWNHNLKLEYKKLGIIGTGASAVQIIPNIANVVKELHVYQRNPPYILPRLQCKFSNFVIKLFTYFPFLQWLLRCFYFLFHETLFHGHVLNSIFHYIFYDLVNTGSNRYLKKQLPDNPNLYEDLTPKYPLGCKRIILSENFYPAFSLPNVKLHTSHIDRIDGLKIYTKDGQFEEIEILVLATGYRPQDYFAPLEIFGENGVNLLKEWKTNGPRSYFGILSSLTPNHFCIMGPNTLLGHSSVLFQIECQTNFIIQIIQKMMEKNMQCVSLKVSAEDEFMKRLKKRMDQTIWGTTKCGSWYEDERGEITNLWPESCIQYWKQTRKVNFSHFEFQ